MRNKYLVNGWCVLLALEWRVVVLRWRHLDSIIKM